MSTTYAALALLALSSAAWGGDVLISEIRIDQPGADDDEYVELAGAPGASLEGLTYLVIGDGGGASGTIEEVTSLDGLALDGSGRFVIAEDSFTLGVADLVTVLNFENSDNVTHLLVAGFSGSNGDDLDKDDDGVIDTAPWSAVVDAIGVIEEENPPGGTEFSYGAHLGFEDIGPDGAAAPGHVYRCDPFDDWMIGPDDPADPDAADTPGDVNPDCPAAPLVALSVEKEGPPSAFSGDQVTYTLTIASDGQNAAPNVTITDTLPAGFTFVSETSPAEVTLDDDIEPTIVWSVDAVETGTEIVIELVVEIGREVEGDVTNTVLVETTSPDDDPDDNQDFVVTTVTQIFDPPRNLVLNEIRTDEPGSDSNEYFELKGDPGTPLDGVSYIVIGDGSPEVGSGAVEMVLDLTGHALRADGLFLAVEDTFFLDPLFIADLVISGDGLNFENGENVTHVLTSNFQGAVGDDLDLDDDGVIDVAIGTHVLDAVGLLLEPNPPTTTEYAYGADLGGSDVGPDGDFAPGHVYRCVSAGTWIIGDFDPFSDEASDTAAAENPACEAEPCPTDIDGDGMTDVDDLVEVILQWNCATPPDTCSADVNGDNVVDVDDLTDVILAWGEC